MGCVFTNNNYRDDAQQVQASHPGEKYTPSTTHPVPFGHVSYAPPLPDVMGPLWGYNCEWWYYIGWAIDDTKTKKFTIVLQLIRTGTSAEMLFGVGYDDSLNHTTKFITKQPISGKGEYPDASSSSWSISFNNNDDTATAKMSCNLVENSGTLGLPGASYVIYVQAEDITASFIVQDSFGTVMEGGSGAFQNKATGERSIEVAMPNLTIKSGSITISGEQMDLVKGNFWLDKETIGYITPLRKSPHGSLYVGNWVGISMNDHDTVYAMIFVWPPAKKGEKQWKVGSELQPPVYPMSKVGLEYPSLPDWGSSPLDLAAEGVNVLRQDEFDLNILDPGDPDNSPHSSSTVNTYCTAWKLMIKGKVYNMKAVVPDSEVQLFSSHAFEGAASIFSIDDDEEVGHAFIEQMGYN